MAAPSTSAPDSVDFPVVRRGYDPAAVHQHIKALERRLRAASQAPARSDAEEQQIIDAAHQRAAALLGDARQAQADADRQLAEAREAIEAAQAERDRVVAEGSAAAEAMLSAARERAETILEGARAVEAEAQSARWTEVGDRVGRILTVADEEGIGLVDEARAEAEAVRADAAAEARRVRDEADQYATESKALADEWAAARIASAEAEQAKATEVLAAARTRAQRIRKEAEDQAAITLEAATRRTTEHVQELLGEARYDLEQLEQRAAEARSYLHGVRELASRTLDTDVVRPLNQLAPSPSALMEPGSGSSGSDEDASDVDPGAFDGSDDPGSRFAHR